MGKRGSKRSASGEDQGLGSQEELHTCNNLQEGNETTSEGVQKRKGDEVFASDNEMTDVKKNKFLRKFTLKDDIKVLRALLKHGFKYGSRDFYRKASLKLSFPADENQIYEKVKGLKKGYLRRMTTGSVKDLSIEKIKIHELSHKIWGVEEEEQKEEGGTSNNDNNKSNDKLEEMRVQEYKEKVANFHRLVFMYKEDDLNAECHVLEALQAAPVALLEKVSFVRSWKDLQLQQFELLKKKRDFISRLTQAVEASPVGLSRI